MADLDRTLAFTALLELHPTFGQERPEDHQDVIRDLAQAMTEANPKDRWSFARAWIADRVAADALAESDAHGAPYVIPHRSRIDYRLALAIARSKHPSRVLANTAVYRYGKFTECPPDGSHPGQVNVHMMGNLIAVFTPEGVRLSGCGRPTVTTSEALSNLVTGGYFYHADRKLIFSSYQTTGCGDCGCRSGQPAADGALYPYV
jgi:hypothetical protein